MINIKISKKINLEDNDDCISYVSYGRQNVITHNLIWRMLYSIICYNHYFIDRKVKVTRSCRTLCNPMDCSLLGSSVHGDSPGKNTGVGCHALLQGIFPIQGFNPGLLHCRQILYYLSHQEKPKNIRVSSLYLLQGDFPTQESNRVSCIIGRFFTSWATWENHR